MAPRWEPYASGHRGQCLTYDAANNHHTMLILAMREWMGREPLAKLKPYYTRTDPVNVWYYDNGCLWKCACWEVCVYGFYGTFEIDEVFRNRCDIVMEPYLRSRVALNAVVPRVSPKRSSSDHRIIVKKEIEKNTSIQRPNNGSARTSVVVVRQWQMECPISPFISAMTKTTSQIYTHSTYTMRYIYAFNMNGSISDSLVCQPRCVPWNVDPAQEDDTQQTASIWITIIISSFIKCETMHDIAERK